jgi:hypothetical protein
MATETHVIVGASLAGANAAAALRKEIFDGRVTAGMNVNVWGVAPAVERLIVSRARSTLGGSPIRTDLSRS